MGRRRGLMSEEFKYELAKDLGFYDTVMREGWEGIRTKDAGNLVKRAIQIAEQKLAQEHRQQGSGAQTFSAQQQAYGTQAPQAQIQQQGYGGIAAQQTQAMQPHASGGQQQVHAPQQNFVRQPAGEAAQPAGYSFAAQQTPQPQFVNPSPSYAYSRTSGFTPMYPSYYGVPPQTSQQPADGSQNFPS